MGGATIGDPAVNIGVHVLLGLTGWLIAQRLRVPLANVLGPVLALGLAASVGVEAAELPGWVKPSIQILVGAMVGTAVTRETLAGMRRIGPVLFLVTAWVLTSGVAIAYVAHAFGELGLATAMLGAAAGGVAEMSTLALALGGDAPMVATLQVFRVVGITFAVPYLATRSKRMAAVPVAAGDVQIGRLCSTTPASLPVLVEDGETDRFDEGTAGVRTARGKRAVQPPGWLGVLAIGAIGAGLFTLLGAPAPALIGSVAAVGAAGASANRVFRLPARVRYGARVTVGILIGYGFTPETATTLLGHAPLILAVTAATIGSGVALAGLVQHWANTDKCTALLSCAPGGVIQMPIIAEELGADVGKVAAFQLARLIAIIVVLPSLLQLLL